jgi:uncharacterized protein YbjQ (UPF0145 family)
VGFFRRARDDDEQQDPDQLWIEQGGIPEGEEARLESLSASGLFTSALTVNEFALLGRLGPRPLAQVMGASVIRVGWQYLPALSPGSVQAPASLYSPTVTGYALMNRFTEAPPAVVRNYLWHADVVCELDVTTDAWNMARRRALERLRDEAAEVGADAVVGVRLRRGEHDLGRRVIEYVVTGTAIRSPGSDPGSTPLLSDLSVQDYWRLRSAGHQPVGLLATTVAVFASPSRFTRLRRQRTRLRNQPLDELTRGFQAAREVARARLLGQVRDNGGTGAVGVELTHDVRREKLGLASAFGSPVNRGWRRGGLGVPYFLSGRVDAERKGWVITMHAAGTAINSGPRQVPLPIEPQIRVGAG